MKLPSRTTQHETGDRALAVLKTALPREWIVREQSHDYGIDVEVEIADHAVSGVIFKGQVKGHEGITWTAADTYFESVREETLNYWRALPVPVVLFLVDVAASQTFWAATAGAVPAAALTGGGVRVRRDDALPKSVDQLARYILTWLDARRARETLCRLPHLARRLERRLESLEYDCFLPLDPEDVEETRDCYQENLQFARSVGMNVASALPWSLWLARSKKIWGADYPLYWGTHDEAVLYAKTIYDEALHHAADLLGKEPVTPENAAVKSFLEHLGTGDNVTYTFTGVTPFDMLSEEQWGKVDDLLKQKGALRHPVVAKRKSD